MGDWTDWSICSKTCDGGIRSRSRDIIQQPMYNGLQCPNRTETEICNTELCPGGNEDLETENSLVHAKLNDVHNIFQLTVRWVIGLVGVSVQRLAMAESDPEAETSYSIRCTTGFNAQTEQRLKSATQNVVQVGIEKPYK